MSLGQNGSQVRFRENVRFGSFSWVIAHDFQQSGPFFRNIPNVHILLLEDIFGEVFIDFWTVGKMETFKLHKTLMMAVFLFTMAVFYD
jgi:hypothetical protein